MTENRRQKIKDWLIGLNNPDATALLHSLNQMDTDNWERKHRKELRMFKGYSDLEKTTIPLRDRARGEFDSFTDNPEWYIKGKAAKLGVNIDDLKKTLNELQEEKEFFEGRKRREDEVKNDFKWNFASDWAKQRYIDTPEKSYWNNPELSFEHIPDIADAAAGFVAGGMDFAPGIIGTYAGPAIRAGRNIVQGQKFGDVMSNAAADVGANMAVDYLPTLILNKINKIAKRGASNIQQYATYDKDLDASLEAAKEMKKSLKGLNNDKLNKLDPMEISKLRRAVADLPESSVKRDIQKILDTNPTDFIKESTDAKLVDDVKDITGLDVGDIGVNKNRIKNYADFAESAIKTNKKVPDVKTNPYDAKGQIANDSKEIINTIHNKQALGQSMNKWERGGAKLFKFGTKVGPGIVKSVDTYHGKRQPVKIADPDRADIDWYKEHYAKDWSLGFTPHGNEKEPIMKAYREWQNEHKIPNISEIF